jgi:hypothetical protein
VTEAVFEWDGRLAHPTPFAAGPWEPSLQHGSAAAALVAWAAEQVPTDVARRVARLTITSCDPSCSSRSRSAPTSSATVARSSCV